MSDMFMHATTAERAALIEARLTADRKSVV